MMNPRTAALLTLFMLLTASLQAQSETLNLPAASVKLIVAANPVLSAHVIATSVKGGQVLQSGPADPRAVPDAVNSVKAALSSHDAGAFPTLAVPRRLLEVNEYLQRVLDSPSNADKPYQLSWSALIDGIRVVTHNEIGSCSTIEVYMEYFAKVTYRVRLTSPSNQNEILDLAIVDPEGLLVHTRCWTLGEKHDLQRHDVNNDLSGAFADRNKVVSSLLDSWLQKNNAEFLDDVTANLAVQNDAKGNPLFDGVSKSWTSDAVNPPLLTWTFTPAPILKAWAVPHK